MDDLALSIDRRFDQVDRRFEQVDQRFEQVDQRFDQVDRRLDRIEDSVRHLTATLMLTGGGLLAAVVGGIATGAFGWLSRPSG
jgi:septal ring factor EnvC (AmiA/AmiB activator)